MRQVHLASALTVLAACSTPGANTSQSPAPADSAAAMMATSASATVIMKLASGADAGTLTVSEAGKSIAISGTLRGLSPGTHGIHLHMVGTCDAPAFASAGEHWNPTGRQHGEENPQGPHLGDLRNITVAGNGTASVQASVSGASLKGANALLDEDGAAIVVHAAADDYRTDPSGNSGARIACGSITPK